MEFKSQERWHVQQTFRLSEEQFNKVIKRMKRRHPLETWTYKKNSSNGERVEYIKLEFVEWLREVYFNDKEFYLDAEIKFFKKQIERLENELNISNFFIDYKDLSIQELREYFNKSKNVIGVAIYRMEKRNNNPSLKYFKDGKLMIQKDGVKWLNENYFRKAYLKKLELYKLDLQRLKRKLYNESRNEIK